MSEITIAHRLAAFLFLAISMTASLFLLDLYRTRKGDGSDPSPRRWQFSPSELGGFSYVNLALISFFGLFLEMLLIRWVSSEIRIFAYFKNFVLIACYLGFGLGCYLCRQRVQLLALLVPLVLLSLLIKLPWAPLHDIVGSLPTYLGVFAEVDIWGLTHKSLDGPSLGALVTAIAFIIPMFALLTILFVPVGQLVGWYLENAPHGISAYTINIVASLGGILCYTLLCFANQPPPVWFAVAGLLFLPLLRRVPRQALLAAVVFAACVGMVSWKDHPTAMEFWSPYQKLVLKPVFTDEGELVRYELTTNNAWYQQIINLSPEFLAHHEDLLQGIPIEDNAYNLPYRFSPQPAATLVLGAGMGNDVAAALRNGSQRVVAVEIDPRIVELGRAYHFEKPYDSPAVETVVDDARSYLQGATEQFDLINFSLLDSHTTSSHFSNIRIDNYVYTVEALQAARKRLKPQGVMVVKFQTNSEWIAGRLKALLTEVFGRPPVEFYTDASMTTGGRFYITGSQERIEAALANAKLAKFVAAHGHLKSTPARLTTDDWPYFYQHEPGLPSSVLILSVLLALLCMFAMRRLETGISSIHWHFFFLGAGFLVMETQVVSKMALLFGTTWLVNSIVISGLLLLIVAANLVVALAGRVPVSLAYAGLFLSILAAYLTPLSALFFSNPWLRGSAATALLCLPVFFAGLVFIQSFSEAKFSNTALGSNLLGALVGGLLESLSLWTGLKSLLVLTALLYGLSWLTRRAAPPEDTTIPVAP